MCGVVGFGVSNMKLRFGEVHSFTAFKGLLLICNEYTYSLN